jgi:DNA replication protein DnaC
MIAMSAGEFDRAARDAAGKFQLTEWFESLASSDVLFMDDLGKGKWTAATAGQFWELIDARSKEARPVFITTNCSGETLVRSLGLNKDVAEPLLRRLRESCKALVLQVKQD